MFRYFISYLITISFLCQMHAQELPHRGFFFQAAALYWQAEEGGLSYAVKSLANHRLSPDARMESPDFEWDLGFQVGLGYRIPHDCWQLKLQFTSLQTHTDAEKKADGEKVFFPIWLHPVPTTQCAEFVKMHWRLHLGLLDAEMDKTFQAMQSLLLTSMLGIRTGWIRQKFNLEYRDGNFEDEWVRMKNKYWGIGPEIGLIGKWILATGFSLFLKGKASLLFGEFYIHQDEDTIDTKEKLLGLHDVFYSSAPILEGHAGFCWQYCFAKALKRLSLVLAWDQLLFFSQNQLLLFLDGNAQGQCASNQGDLIIAGVQFEVRCDF